MMNPFGISGSWRVDPDNRQDRGSSEVKSYKLSPEEIQKLIAVIPVPKIKTEVEDMRKITVEQLTEECSKLGFNAAAYEDIAKRYGFSNAHSVECIVSKKGIKKLLEKEPETKPAITELETAAVLEIKPDMELASADELEVLDKIKAIVAGNKQHLKSALEENKALKSRLAKIKTMLEEVLYEL